MATSPEAPQPRPDDNDMRMQAAVDAVLDDERHLGEPYFRDSHRGHADGGYWALCIVCRKDVHEIVRVALAAAGRATAPHSLPVEDGDRKRNTAGLALLEAADAWDSADEDHLEHLRSLAREHYQPGGSSMPAIWLRDRARALTEGHRWLS